MLTASVMLLAASGASAWVQSARTGFSRAATPYTTIQQAIDAARDGDRVLVEAGAYRENIDFKGKAIAVKSLAGASLTTIDGGFAGAVVTFASGEGALSVLDGFTITHGAVAGGIWCAQSAPTLIDNIITANSADAYGGAITCLDASPFIGSNHISGNSTFGSGGAIHCVRSRAVIDGNVLEANSAFQDGGGIYSVDAPQLVVRTNTIKGNTTFADGGGVACLSGAVQLTDNALTLNAAWGDGGGLFGRAVTPTIHGNDITLNRADFGAGGGVHLRDVPAGEVSSNWIEQNSSPNYEGAGVYVDHSVIDLVDDVVRDNTLGGVACVDGALATLLRCEISENSAITGGGLMIWHASPQVLDCVIEANEATDSGGGVYALGGSCLLANCLVVRNTAAAADGGGCYFLDATPRLVACTVADNRATGGAGQRGGGVCMIGSGAMHGLTATIENSIVWGNQAAAGSEIFTELTVLRVNYCDVGGGWEGEHNLAADPRFSSAGPYQLSEHSPCVNRGNPAARALPDHDLYGDPRSAFGSPDMGADEFFTILASSLPSSPR